MQSNRLTQQDIDALRREINAFYAETSSWREVGLALGKSASYAMRVVRGDLRPTRPALESWRMFKTGKPVHYVEVPPCPDCGLVHTGRCHGKTVAAVAVLAPDERITKAPKSSKPRKHYHRPCLTAEEWADFLAWRAERRASR